MKIHMVKIINLLFFFCFAFSVNANYSWENREKEYLYTLDNELGENSIRGYEINHNGDLVELANSPFHTGGSGINQVLFSENAIVVNKEKTLLFAVNPGTNDITVMRIARNGNLIPVKGSPFPTGGSVPVSLAISKNVLYVSHIGTTTSICDGCDLRGFYIKKKGKLISIPNSKIEYEELPASFPLAIEFSPDGKTLVGTQFAFQPISNDVNFINTYNLDRKTGLLSEAPGSPINSIDTQPIGFGFNPIDPSQLFVSATVSVRQEPGVISSYLLGANGQVAPQINGRSSSSGDQDATCWVALTSDGKYLFATNTFSDTVSRFKVARDGSTELIGVTAVPQQSSSIDIEEQPLEIVITSGDKFAYLVNGNLGGVVGFRIVNGNLIALPNFPKAINEGKPFGLINVVKRSRY